MTVTIWLCLLIYSNSISLKGMLNVLPSCHNFNTIGYNAPEIKIKIALETGRPYDTQSLGTESELGKSCFPTRKQTRAAAKRHYYQSRGIPLNNGHQQRYARGYDNMAFELNEGEDKSPVKPQMNHKESSKIFNIHPEEAEIRDSGFTGDMDPEVVDIETLIRQQREEIESLEEEMTSYKSTWEQRLKDIRRRHREERRKLLRLMDDREDSDTKYNSHNAVGKSPRSSPRRSPRAENSLSSQRQRYDEYDFGTPGGGMPIALYEE